MSPTSEMIREAFRDALAEFLVTSSLIGDGQWDLPATDRWNVLELFAHTARGMSLIVEYLDLAIDPAARPTIVDPEDYFRLALSAEGVHQGIAERAVAAVPRYRDRPVDTAHDVAVEVLQRVASTPDDRAVQVFVETLRFIDYLQTRIVELVLHTFDLQLACALTLRAPASSLAVVSDVLLQLADRADPMALILALSGRTSALRCNVLG